MTSTHLRLSLAGALALALAATGCGSGGLGDMFGGGTTTAPPPGGGVATNELQGTVADVDPQRRVIAVRPDTANLRGGDDVVVLEYHPQTRVMYRGQVYRPEDLERGDRIVARIDPSGPGLQVDQIQVMRDVSPDDRFAGRYPDEYYDDDRYDRYDDDNYDRYDRYDDRYDRYDDDYFDYYD